MDILGKKLVVSDSDEEIEFSTRKKHGRQAFRIVESDSEVENFTTVTETDEMSKNLNENGFADNSNESEHSHADNDNIEVSAKRKKKKKKKSDERKIAARINICDQDSSSDESEKQVAVSKINICDQDSSSDESEKQVAVSKINICDQDSSSDESNKEVNTDNEPKGKRAPQRMSAKQAEEQMKIIQSESQRLARQCNLSVPYHKPKSYSLKDFLNRKTINKPVPMAVTKKAAATIKMSKEELEQYAKSLEDRNKESQEFYRSDSDESVVNDTIENSKSEKHHVGCNQQEILEQNAPTSIVEPVNEINLDIAVENVADIAVENVADIAVENVADIAVENVANSIPYENDIEKLGNVADHHLDPKTIEIDYDFGEKETNERNSFKDYLSLSVIEKPCLKGPIDGVINLYFDDVTSTKSGGDELFERFIKHVGKKPTSTAREVSILSAENGIIEVKNLKFESEDQNCIHSKPRTDRFKLKEELSLRIVAKRKEELLKKQIFVKQVVDDSDSDVEILPGGKLCEDEDNGENESEKETNVDLSNDLDDVDWNNDENIDVNEDDNEEKTDDDDDNIECGLHESSKSVESIRNWSADQSAIEKPKRRKRILVMDNSDDEESMSNENEKLSEKEDDLNSSSLQEQIHMGSVQQTDPTISQISKNQNLADEMIDLCSKIVPENNYVDNSISALCTQTTDIISESQLLDLCSGKFVTQSNTYSTSCVELSSEQKSGNLSDNEFSDDDISLPNKAKQRKRINISDDEEHCDEVKNVSQEGNNSNNSKNNSDESNAVDEILSEEETEERMVEYDSEENEIEVPVVKKLRISEFLENEAELSESEWGSADEDENNLDKFEMELGDEDEFDENQLHSELDRIHRRRMLDQDAREVKIIKDTLFEDEEENGLGRQRQFKWKHMENSMNLEENKSDDVDVVAKSDDENEETWRRMRHERNSLLQETKNQNDTVNETTLSVATKPKKRISIIKNPANLNTSVTKDLSFLISKIKEEQTHRSSLLMRDEATLANLSKIASDDGIPSVNTNSKNFLFNVICSDDEKSLGKRKLDHILDDGEDDSKSKPRKKPKNVKKSTLSVLDKMF